MTLSYTGKGGRKGGREGGKGLSSWQVQPNRAGCREEDRLKAAPSPAGWGLTTPPRKQQLVTETATTKFAP